jgi:hypothetical protein
MRRKYFKDWEERKRDVRGKKKKNSVIAAEISRVNFTNVLCAAFTYVSCAQGFFVLTF